MLLSLLLSIGFYIHRTKYFKERWDSALNLQVHGIGWGLSGQLQHLQEAALGYWALRQVRFPSPLKCSTRPKMLIVLVAAVRHQLYNGNF